MIICLWITIECLSLWRQLKNGIVPLAEVQAVGFENYLRASLNETGYNVVRETYRSKFLNIVTPVKILEYRNQEGLPQYGLGWTSPWDLSDFINKKEKWIELRNVALKKYTAK